MRLIAFLFLASILPAATPPTISQKRLDALVLRWQKVLKLQDWDIRAVCVKLEDLPEGTMGGSQADRSYRVLHVYVLDPSEYGKAAIANDTVEKTGREILADIEDTVVHELVHLRLKDLVQASESDLKTAEELTVNRFTSALLRKGKL